MLLFRLIILKKQNLIMLKDLNIYLIFEKMTLKGEISKAFISGFHNVIMKIIGRESIAKKVIQTMYVRMTSFIENQLIGPLPYDNILTGEFLREYLLFMDGSRLYSNIQKFLDAIATKLIGISNINGT